MQLFNERNLRNALNLPDSGSDYSLALVPALLYYSYRTIGQVAVFPIDEADPTPLYAQLERAIRAAIATGRLQPGDKLPTVRQLAVDLRINANTVAKVYGELERSGAVSTRRGIGTFVADLASQASGISDREQQLIVLVDRFLGGAAALGFSATDAIALITARCNTIKEEKSDA